MADCAERRLEKHPFLRCLFLKGLYYKKKSADVLPRPRGFGCNIRTSCFGHLVIRTGGLSLLFLFFLFYCRFSLLSSNIEETPPTL